MKNSEAAVTYSLKSLFSSLFEFDGTTEVMIVENVKRGCPHIWKDPNYRVITNKFFDWWMQHMPYIYLAMLEDKKFVPLLYDRVRQIVDYDKRHLLDGMVYDSDRNILVSRLCTGTVYSVDFTKFNKDLYTKILADLEKSMHALDEISDVVDWLINGLSSSKGYQISYICCNFMYLLLALMHDDKLCELFEAMSAYYQEIAKGHAAKYNEEEDNPEDFKSETAKTR